jgi:hypothetical protein
MAWNTMSIDGDECTEIVILSLASRFVQMLLGM